MPDHEDSSADAAGERKRLQKEYDVDEDIAEQAQELIDEGLDEDEAIEIAEDI